MGERSGQHQDDRVSSVDRLPYQEASCVNTATRTVARNSKPRFSYSLIAVSEPVGTRLSSAPAKGGVGAMLSGAARWLGGPATAEGSAQ